LFGPALAIASTPVILIGLEDGSVRYSPITTADDGKQVGIEHLPLLYLHIIMTTNGIFGIISIMCIVSYTSNCVY
jgi:hypothetical protein